MTTKPETTKITAMTDASVEKYMDKPYTLTLKRDVENDVWVARVVELAGCTAHGSTRSEALQRLENTQRRWIAGALRIGKKVPEPNVSDEEREFSGRWVQRVPRYLHAELVSVARSEDTSLNSLCETFLARAVGEYRAHLPYASLRTLWGNGVLGRSAFPRLGGRPVNWVVAEPMRLRGLYRLKQYADVLTQRIPDVDDQLWPMEGHVNELIAHIRD